MGWSKNVFIKRLGAPAVLLVLLGLGAAAAFYVYLDWTASEPLFVNAAGRQRMLTQQMAVYAEMMREGQASDRPRFRRLVEAFDANLRALDQGGRLADGEILPPPPEGIRGELAAVLEGWGRLRKDVEELIVGSPKDARFREAHARVKGGIPEVVAAEDGVVSAYVARSRRLRNVVMWLLLAGTAASILILASLANAFSEMLTAELRKRSSEESARAGLMSIIEHVFDVVVVTDADGAIEYVNPSFERLTGWTAAEARGRKPSLLKSGRHEPAFYSRLWQTIKSGRPWRSRVTNRTKDGRLIEVEQVITPIREASGRVAHFVAVGRDMTAFAALERRLREADRLDSIGRLSGGVAHDFNNILTSILGCADMALQGLPEGDSRRGDILEIIASAKRGSALTRQLLAFGKEQHLRPAVLDLGAVVKGMARMLERLLGTNVRLAISAAESLPAVNADPAQVEQVVMNLVVNARDAMPEGGTVSISLENVALDKAYVEVRPDVVPGCYVRLSVSDTGHGMDAETLERIFEPFFTTKGGKGTGLGLATVYGIVKQSGGHVDVFSEPGKGTTFQVHWPRGGKAGAAT